MMPLHIFQPHSKAEHDATQETMEIHNCIRAIINCQFAIKSVVFMYKYYKNSQRVINNL